ncbi:MAG: N-acetylmuramic acid 6-phosphate etherase [Chloroflexi bacterium]|nr:MAG: N-acetylmuramic acid 6-phosphate etherase [Chloroflexota bacterium]
MERPTESRNPRAKNLSALPTREILELLNDEDATVPAAVRGAIPAIERAVDLVVPALRGGHRLLYLGAGTSGRLGVLDASEMPPTFGVDPEVVVGIRDLGDHLRPGDVVVGISASGRAPYVVDAVASAKAELGAAATVGVTCTPGSALARAVDVAIVVEVGPEVIAGSSRMKAGTATKLVLNMLSTTAMVKLGRTRDDLMVDLRATNEKLRQRAIRMVQDEARVTAEDAEARLVRAGWHVRAAIDGR